MSTPTRRLTRRLVLRAVFTAGVVAGTAGALAPVIARTGARQSPLRPAEPERFAEMYRGRHIQGSATALVPVAARGDGRPGPGAVPGAEVRIDGRPLEVMRRSDGGYLSVVNHYESFPTLREAARAAVEELGSARLALAPPHGH
ncbi:tyrosinase family oxidase copper chaperone [Streptomyces katsurahamanus]|uniref:Tyrosinase n=1 Tax=Streptomyces katsurahamanus TaxID=2577098 RepID=A0ABW9NQ39_9ACTN|nr:tyrosinase family oxidase copper chaperone [Streptomyces katsurahamanus]MQS35403.1 tyrosinase [Streptomyces katsurahamanus]